MPHYCIFQAASRQFAICVTRIREIGNTHPLMPVPGGPNYILGLALYRGQAITVWDLKVCLGETSGGVPKFDLIFDSQEPFGLQVEQVFDVIPFPEGSLEPVPGTVLPILRKICGGLLNWRGQAVLLLEPEQLIKTMLV